MKIIGNYNLREEKRREEKRREEKRSLLIFIYKKVLYLESHWTSLSSGSFCCLKIFKEESTRNAI